MPKQVFVHFHLQLCFALQRREIFPPPNFKECSEPHTFCTFSLSNLLLATAACIFSSSELQKVLQTPHVLRISFPHVLFATAACNFSTSELRKVLRNCHVLYIFTSKYVFRHSGVHFFDRRTAKSASDLTCFVHFHFKMCFSPQRRAIFDFSPDHPTPHPPL